MCALLVSVRRRGGGESAGERMKTLQPLSFQQVVRRPEYVSQTAKYLQTASSTLLSSPECVPAASGCFPADLPVVSLGVGFTLPR